MDALQRAAARLGLRGDEADEVVQQTLLFAWSRRDEIDFTRPLVPYLARVLMFEARKQRTASARRPDRDRMAELTGEDPSIDAQRRELREGLTTMIEQLPNAQRRVLQLRLRYDMEPHEIAAQLECAPGAVRVSLHRGMSRLRTLLPRGWNAAVLPWLHRVDLRSSRHGFSCGAATLAAAALVVSSMSMFWAASADLAPTGSASSAAVAGEAIADVTTWSSPHTFAAAARGHLRERGAVAASVESQADVVSSFAHEVLAPASGANAFPVGLPLDAGPWADRYAAAVAIDPRGRTLVFGGRSQRGSSLSPSSWLGDGWLAYGGTAQRLVGQQPIGRINAAMVFDAARRQFVMFGGRRGRVDLEDTWVFDDSGWRELAPHRAPPARHFASFVYDEMQQLAVLHGGTHGSEATRGDTWVWNGTQWAELSLAVAPSPRRGAAMAFDAVRGVSVLYGGCDAWARPLLDTWELGAQGWRVCSTAANPGDRNWHAMTFDRALGLVVLQGGVDVGRPRGDAWLFDGADWVRATSSSSEPRAGHALVFDPVRRRTVAVGNVPFSGSAAEGAAEIVVTSVVPQVSGIEFVLVRRAAGGDVAPTRTTDALGGSALLDADACLDAAQLDTLLDDASRSGAAIWLQRVRVGGGHVSAGSIDRR